MATVTSHYARSSLAGARRAGKNITEMLELADLSRQLINAPDSRVHSEQLANLVRIIWLQLEDEFMGFTTHPCKPGSFAMMSKLVSYSDTLDAVFKQGIEFYRLLTDDIQMHYRQLPDSRELKVIMSKPALDPEHFFQEFWLVIWHRFASWLVGEQIKLQAVYFDYPRPAHADEFEFQFACPCYFNADTTKLCFSKHYALRPPIRTQQELSEFIKRLPSDFMTIPGNDSSLTRTIKNYLQEAFSRQQPLPDLQGMANLLQLSSQSLRRKLSDEGTGYQKLKDNFRCDIAMDKLVVQNMTVNDISDMLGFTEPRSFTRAFKQWTGQPPSMYQHRSKNI